MSAHITRDQLCKRWESTSYDLDQWEDIGRPDREAYVLNKGYPMELILKIEKEDRARVFPEFNPICFEEAIAAMAHIRAQIGSRRISIGHISSARALAHSAGLLLWEINRVVAMQVRHKAEDPFDFFFSSRYADKLSSTSKKAGVPGAMQTLLKHGIVSKIGEPVRGMKNTEYRLNRAWYGICPPSLIISQNIKLRKIKAWSLANQDHRRPWLVHVDATFVRTILPDTPKLDAALKSKKQRASTLTAREALENYHTKPGFRAALAKYCGTIYHPLSSLPKALVPTLHIDGEKVAQLDISAAHPCALYRIIMDHAELYGDEELRAEAALYLGEVQAGALYMRFASGCGIPVMNAKRRFLQALNGKNHHTYNEEVFKLFARLFPLCGRVVAIVRKPDRKELNRRMAFLVSQAIDGCLKLCMEQGLPAYPRTDEIVCRERDADSIRKALAASFFKTTSVNPKVGGVSFPLEEIEAAAKLLIGNSGDYR